MDEIYAALVGGLSGVICALITAKLSSSATAKATDRAEQARAEDMKRSAAFLTSQVAPNLRSYAGVCLAITNDDGFSRDSPNNGHNHAIAQVSEPRFQPSELDVQWESLPTRLMTSILVFPEHAQTAAAPLDDDDGYYDPPDHVEYYFDRQKIYCQLGLDALRLVEDLHHHLDLPQHEHGKSLKAALEVASDDLKRRAEERRLRHVEYAERLNALSFTIEAHQAAKS